jgi:hypothetical protein
MGELVVSVPLGSAGEAAVAHIRERGERELGCSYSQSLLDKLEGLECRSVVGRLPTQFHLVYAPNGDEILVANRIRNTYTGEVPRRGRVDAVDPNVRFRTSGPLGLPFALGGMHSDYLRQMRHDKVPAGTTGRGIRVAVIDSGLDAGAGLTPARAYDVNATPVLQSASLDTDGHGTAMATLIHAVAVDAEIFVIRAFDNTGIMPLWHLLAAVPVAAYECSAAIVSMSLGFASFPLQCPGCGATQTARLLAYEMMLTGIRQHPTYGGDLPIYVAATGNTEATGGFEFPAFHTESLAVGAVTSTGARSSFSNYGTPNHAWHLMAPGGEETKAAGVTEDVGHGKHEKCRGTSVSTAYVSGMLALLRSESRYQTKSRQDFLADVLRDHCERPAGASALEHGAGQIVYVKQGGDGDGTEAKAEDGNQQTAQSRVKVHDDHVSIGGIRVPRRRF